MSKAQSPGVVKIYAIESVKESEKVSYWAIIMERMKGSLADLIKAKMGFS